MMSQEGTVVSDWRAAYLVDIRARFEAEKQRAERAIAQVAPERWSATVDKDANSIGVLLKHIGGNLRSRWTDFLTTDGEKADRQRDTEFVLTAADTRSTLMDNWNLGWTRLFDTLESLQPDDLSRLIAIRSEHMTAFSAIHRSLAHVAGHVGQIVLLARHLAGDGWQTLSIPRGASERVNEEARLREQSSENRALR
jgi:hypothetical protein